MARAFVLPFEPLRGEWRERARAIGLFFLGSMGALLFVESATGPVPWVLLSGMVTGVDALARLEPKSRAARVVRFVARGLVVLLSVSFVGEALLWASLLWWTVAGGVWVLLLALAVGAGASATTRWQKLRVPAIVPVGALSAACLLGWAREEWRVRCDDVLAVTAQPGVTIAVPVREDLGQCPSGEWLPIGRYPRKVWPAPDGRRVVFTTQEAIHETFRPDTLPSHISGLVCSTEEILAPAQPAPPVSCLVQHGKAHAIVEDAARDRLLVGILSGLDGRAGGIVSVSRSEPLRELGRAVLRQGGNFYLDPVSDRLGEFGDEGRVLDFVRASDLTPLEQGIPASFLGPDFVRYDPRTREGVACSASGPVRTMDGVAPLAVAFHGFPFAARPLAPSSRYPSSWLALSWGCDWSADHERVFVAASTLGQLVTIDRRTGDVLDRAFVGFGVRPLTFDPARNVVFLANFLRGDVIAFDVGARAITRRWFAGRYVRDLELTPDGKGLLVTSNVGIVRINLGG